MFSIFLISSLLKKHLCSDNNRAPSDRNNLSTGKCMWRQKPMLNRAQFHKVDCRQHDRTVCKDQKNYRMRII